MKSKSIIIIPYAFREKANTSVNIKAVSKQTDVYMKNLCVACISARKNNDENTDVALVSNIVPPAEYKALLESQGVKIINADFDSFNFDGRYTWCLAFYKLCALQHVVNEYDYTNYAYIDTDVYVQSSFNDIWEECKSKIMLYDIGYGLYGNNYCRFLSEYESFTPPRTPHLCTRAQDVRMMYPTYYGGEFFVANRANAMLFVEKCTNVYNKMRQLNFVTEHGDEFITNNVAIELSHLIKNAGAYIYRFWTRSFRMISMSYRFVTVLHVPAEKEHGMISIYDRYIKKGKLPSVNRVHNLLHIKRPSFAVAVYIWLKEIKEKLK